MCESDQLPDQMFILSGPLPQRVSCHPLEWAAITLTRPEPCRTSKTRMCARLEIRTGRLAHTHVASRRARAVRAKCSLAGLTNQSPSRAATRGARAACVSTWSGEGRNVRLALTRAFRARPPEVADLAALQPRAQRA